MTQVVELYLNWHFTLSRTQLACLNVQYYVNAMDSLSHRGSCKHFQVNVLY